MISRHRMRVIAFQILFALNANPDTDVDHLYSELLGDEEVVPEYLEQLINGVREHQDELDQTITAYLKQGWSLNRLSKTDLVILRLALYEIKFEKLPAKVAVNEAIELAKQFSDDTSRRFINGLLSKLIDSSEN